MFRLIAIIGFLVTLMLILYRYKRVRHKSAKSSGLQESLRNSVEGILRALERMRTVRPEEMTEDWRGLVYSLTVVSFILLALTGFVPVVFFGKPVSGFVLLFHAFAAPVFAVGLAILALLWAHHHRFDKNDWQSSLHVFRRKAASQKSSPRITRLGQKISFWLILLLSLPVIVSIILSMVPLFGTQGQTVLLHLHGYAALLLVIAAVTSFYLLKLARKADTDK